jgi:surfeit locus 1 family protein
VGDCPRAAGEPRLELHAIEDGVLGRRWISACPLEGGPYPAILVDLGFVPQGASPALEPGGVRAVVGFLRAEEPPTRFSPSPSPDQTGRTVWYRRDVAGMSAALGVRDPAPVFLMLESPAPAGGLPRPAPLPARISNNHLGYAITWFGLAAALVGVYLGMMFKKRVRA